MAKVIDVLWYGISDALGSNSGDVLRNSPEGVFSCGVGCFIALCSNVNNNVRVEPIGFSYVRPFTDWVVGGLKAGQ